MDNDFQDSTFDSVETVNKFLRESTDPTKDIAENVDDIHKVLAEVVEAPEIGINTSFKNISCYKRLYNCITGGDINILTGTISEEFGTGNFVARVMTNDEILDPENDNISEILPTSGGNPEEATVGLLILKKNLQTNANEQIYYVPNPKELMITLGGD
jgi:hypothetical protein